MVSEIKIKTPPPPKKKKSNFFGKYFVLKMKNAQLIFTSKFGFHL